MMTITVLPNGNIVYSLKAYTGKHDAIVSKFFDKSLSPYHKILASNCGDCITSFEDAEHIYNKLYAHASRILSPWMFIWNFHNFVAFLQQYKQELEKIGVNSFFPYRDCSAIKVSKLEFDPDGVQVEEKPKRKRNHYEDLSPRISSTDHTRRSNYFDKWIVKNKKNVTDDTYVLRTDDGSAPVIFFNIVKGDINVPETVTDIKAYEVDRLKAIYANITGINYLKVRPVTYKTWKKLSDNKKIGTKVTSISPEIQKSIKFMM